MLVELNNILSLDNPVSMAKKSLLVLESGTDSSFVLHHFLSYFLRCQNRVCFVALSHTFNHYNSVATKLGTPLAGHRDSGSLLFMEVLKEIGNELGKESEAQQGNCDRARSEGTMGHGFHSSAMYLKNIYKNISKFVHDSEGNAPYLLVVDDVSVLLDLGFTVKDVFMFLRYLQGLVKNGHKKTGTLLSLVKSELDGEEEDADCLSKQLIHLSDITFHCTALSSGYCKDVHGQVKIC